MAPSITGNSLETTKIWPDCKHILDDDSPIPTNTYLFTLHTVKEDISMPLFETIIYQSDYVSNMSDYIYLVLKLGIGHYLESVHPFRDNLEVTVTKIETTDTVDDINKITTNVRYKAILLNSDRLYDGTYLDNVSTDTADKEGLVSLDIQLLDVVVEVMKTIEVGGIYKNKTNNEIMLGVVNSEFDKITIDGKKGLDAINITEGDNKSRIAHSVIPNGIRAIDLPGFLQYKNQGVYNADIGTYITKYKDKLTCFIYPLYNTVRYEKAVNKLTLFSIPTTRYKIVEKTWLEESGNLQILLGDEEVSISEGEAKYMDEGVGFRMADGNSMMKKPVIMTKDGPLTDRTSLNYEVANKNREDGVDYTPLKSGSSNPFVHYSDVNKRAGMLVSFNWAYSNPDLLYPAMPVEYRFLKNGKLTKLQGSLIGKTSTSNKEGITTTKVVLFILRYNYDTVNTTPTG